MHFVNILYPGALCTIGTQYMINCDFSVFSVQKEAFFSMLHSMKL